MIDDYESDGFNDEWSDEYDYFSEPSEYEERSYEENFCDGFLFSLGEVERNEYDQMSLEEILKSDLCIEIKFILYLRKKYKIAYYDTMCEIKKSTSDEIIYSIILRHGAYDLPNMSEREIKLGDSENYTTSKFVKRGQLEINDIKNIRQLGSEIFIDLYDRIKEKFELKSDEELVCDLNTNTVTIVLNKILYVSNCDNIKILIGLMEGGMTYTDIKILNTNDVNFVYNLESYFKLIKEVNLKDTNLKMAMDIFEKLEPKECVRNFNGEYEIKCKEKLNYNNKYISSVGSEFYDFSGPCRDVYVYTVTEDNLFRLSKGSILSNECANEKVLSSKEGNMIIREKVHMMTKELFRGRK